MFQKLSYREEILVKKISRAMSRKYKEPEVETHTTNPEDYPHYRPFSMEFGGKIENLSHKPSFIEVIKIIINLIPRSKVKEFLRNHTDNFFVDVTDRKYTLLYNETTGLFFKSFSIIFN
jgi:hypothetical protein